MAFKGVTEALKKLTRSNSSVAGTSIEEESEGDEADFCVEDNFPSKDLSVTVEDVGNLAFPVSEDTVKKLIDVSTKAKFGKGEATNLDTRVRHFLPVVMIPASKLKVEINKQSLENILTRVRVGLQLGGSSRLVPHLHNMLIHSPGQFFNNRYSEETKDVFAILVVVLPCPHKGGELIVEHNYNKHVFFGSHSPDYVKCAVFYSDCEYEIKKTTEGFRLALTYNLVLDTPKFVCSTDVDQNLNKAVKLYFDQYDHPKRLIYCLNHDYSELSLRWDLLKGTDRVQAFALYSVGKNQGRVPCLALFDHNVCFGVKEDLINKIDEVSNVIFCVDERDKVFEAQDFDLDSISEEEFCFTKETSEFQPYLVESEPRGNECAVIDHMYKRACVVLWSKKLVFYHGYKEMLHNLHAFTLEKGNEEILLDEINKIGLDFFNESLWNHAVVVDMLFDIVIYLNDKTFACSVLTKIPLYFLNPKRVGYLIKFEKQYDNETWKEICSQWKPEEFGWDMTLENFKALHKEYIKTSKETVNSTVIQNFTSEIVDGFIKTDKDAGINHYNYNRKLGGFFYSYYQSPDNGRIEKISDLFEFCCSVNESTSLNRLIDYVITSPDMYSLQTQVALLLKLKSILPPDQLERITTLRDHALKSVENQLTELSLSSEDWYLPVKINCDCEYCKQVELFFYSRTSNRTEVPTVEGRSRCVCVFLQRLKSFPIKFYMERNKIIVEKDPKLLMDKKKRLKQLKLSKEFLVTFPEFSLEVIEKLKDIEKMRSKEENTWRCQTLFSKKFRLNIDD